MNTKQVSFSINIYSKYDNLGDFIFFIFRKFLFIGFVMW